MRQEIAPEEIAALIAALRAARDRRHLAEILGEALSLYTLPDLQHLRGIIEHEFRDLPAPYRRKLYPRAIEQVFGAYHDLMLHHRRSRHERWEGPLPPLYPDFCRMLQDLALNDTGNRLRKYDLLYYLLAAFTMFVRELPGHPVGTPFPGGFFVESRNGEYYCPVREKEDDVETSICPFCPAKQAELPK
ncbi:MAG: DUF2115 domain-containing protein [Methanomicrobiales archaeon]|nr:DUF2115 domain-containing protein [Methanomicrobiales archaeon]